MGNCDIMVRFYFLVSTLFSQWVKGSFVGRMRDNIGKINKIQG